MLIRALKKTLLIRFGAVTITFLLSITLPFLINRPIYKIYFFEPIPYRWGGGHTTCEMNLISSCDFYKFNKIEIVSWIHIFFISRSILIQSKEPQRFRRCIFFVITVCFFRPTDQVGSLVLIIPLFPEFPAMHPISKHGVPSAGTAQGVPAKWVFPPSKKGFLFRHHCRSVKLSRVSKCRQYTGCPWFDVLSLIRPFYSFRCFTKKFVF